MTESPWIVRKEVMDKFNEDYPKRLYKELKEKGETSLDEARFLNEWKLSTLVSHAENDQKSAIEILRLSVQFLKEADRGQLGLPLPTYLGNYLGTAFEKALHELDTSENANMGHILGKALSDALYITANNRRPVNSYDVAAYMLQFIENGMSLNNAAIETSIDFDISESSAKRCFREMASFFRRKPNGKKI